MMIASTPDRFEFRRYLLMLAIEAVVFTVMMTAIYSFQAGTGLLRPPQLVATSVTLVVICGAMFLFLAIVLLVPFLIVRAFSTATPRQLWPYVVVAILPPVIPLSYLTIVPLLVKANDAEGRLLWELLST